MFGRWWRRRVAQRSPAVSRRCFRHTHRHRWSPQAFFCAPILHAICICRLKRILAFKFELRISLCVCVSQCYGVVDKQQRGAPHNKIIEHDIVSSGIFVWMYNPMLLSVQIRTRMSLAMWPRINPTSLLYSRSVCVYVEFPKWGASIAFSTFSTTNYRTRV